MCLTLVAPLAPLTNTDGARFGLEKDTVDEDVVGSDVDEGVEDGISGEFDDRVDEDVVGDEFGGGDGGGGVGNGVSLSNLSSEEESSSLLKVK